MNHKIHNILFGLLLALLFWLPIPLGSNRPWAWSIMQLMVFSLSLGCIYVFWQSLWQTLKPYRLVIFLWLAFLLLAAIQFIPLPASVVAFLSPNSFDIQQSLGVSNYYLSLDIGQTQIAFVKGLSYFCLFTVTLLLVNNERKIKFVMIAMLLTGTLQALYGAFEIQLKLEYSAVFHLPVSNRATGSFVYHNHFANFIMLCLAAGIGLIVSSLQTDRIRSKRDWLRSSINTLLSSKALVRISLAIMVVALVMSRSRMGNTAFFVSMTVIGLLSLVLIKQRSRGLTILIVSMLIIDTLIVSTWFGLDKVQQRLVETNLSSESRDEVVLDSLEIVKDFPLFGSGGGSFYSTFPSYTESDVHIFYDQAHNDYLQMAIEYGLPSFMLLSCIMLICFYRSLHALRTRRHPILKGAAFAASMAILGMAIHMTVDFPMQAPANASYLVVFLSLALLTTKLQIQTPRSSRTQHQH